ncbi:hypothetical protein E4P43_06195, partial [Blastococcus sp. TF02A-35]
GSTRTNAASTTDQITTNPPPRGAAGLRQEGVAAVERRLLRRRGRVRDSAGLTAAQRRANLAGTFVPDPRGGRLPVGALVVVVDDVVTTGATLCAAAAVLSDRARAGGPAVLAAVLAATPRPSATPRPGTSEPLRYRAGNVPGGHHDRLSGPGRSD